MSKITYIEADGKTIQVDLAVGDSVMQGAVNNMIEGIVGECGGSCICGTCHCYIDEKWSSIVGPPNIVEEGMLELSDLRKPNSRLGCQITISEEMDGLVVRLPESQY